MTVPGKGWCLGREKGRNGVFTSNGGGHSHLRMADVHLGSDGEEKVGHLRRVVDPLRAHSRTDPHTEDHHDGAEEAHERRKDLLHTEGEVQHSHQGDHREDHRAEESDHHSDRSIPPEEGSDGDSRHGEGCSHAEGDDRIRSHQAGHLVGTRHPDDMVPGNEIDSDHGHLDALPEPTRCQ